MFYATKIREVGNGKAVDEQGKVLSFIGYLPVEVGDIVFTDGTVIFGNAKVKGTPATFSQENSGIPVLADQNFRGYFTKDGAYKKYSVAGTNWLVNAKRSYAHDLGEGIILDAEIARDENRKEIGVYTVEKNIIQIGTLDNLHADFISRNNELIQDCEIIIYKNSEEQERIALSDLSKKAEDFALAYVNIVEVEGQKPMDLVSTDAAVTTFKIMPDGTWQMLVDFSIFAKRQFRRRDASIKANPTSTESYNKGTFPNNFPWGGDRADIAAAFRELGFSDVTTEIVLRDSALAQSFYNVFADTMQLSYTESLIHYGTSSQLEISFEDTDYFYDTTASCDFLIYFCSDGTVKKVYEEGYCTPLIMDVTNYEGNFQDASIPNSFHIDASDDKNSYPYLKKSDSYKFVAGGYRWELIFWTFRGTAIYKRFKEDGRNYCHVSWYRYCYDSRNLPNAPPYNQTFYSADENFFFPIQDDYSAWIVPTFNPRDRYFTFLNGVYDSTGKALIGNLFPKRNNVSEWNMAIAMLNHDAILFGIHDDSLYKISPSGAVTTLATGLKNFRLRELKNITKAKK